MPVASATGFGIPPIIFSAGPPVGGLAEKIKIALVIAIRAARPTAKSCRRSAAKPDVLSPWLSN
ncbi:hypothetical protein K227x_55630 [Rubripirellula lacrimiformis]|uniref:Uncharacterized protein n=1 Tax=Rubripirellula lacrimiformis TaxID=1930273 RepID=A0A517NJ63_9BACT|nr:hypothetical protein K227x_55630 [Rubripirellula lacrimiformis]